MNLKNKTLLAGLVISGPIAATAQIPAGLEGYTHYFDLSLVNPPVTDVVGTVGSWSWEDSRLGDDVFWRHQSDWIAFNLADPANVRFEVARHAEGDNSKFFPSFTLYSGFNDTADGAHFGNNKGNVQWETDSNELSYLMHHDNSTEASAEETVFLPAGDYTLLLGGNAVAEATAVNVNYTANFTASPIPEPSTSLLSLLAGLAALARRKR